LKIVGSLTPRRIAASGIAAVLLAALPFVTGGTRFESIGVPFMLPGVFAGAIVFSTGIHSDHPLAYMVLAGVLNVVFIWAVLLLTVKPLERFLKRKREQE
jgi:hypothetical protein